MAIIAVSGKISSGKDEVGNIIHYFRSIHTDSEYNTFFDYSLVKNGWDNQKFAGKLKDMVCMLLGCTREQLEDREFKEKELGEEWWYYLRSKNRTSTMYLYVNGKPAFDVVLIKLTPRSLLQILGTDCGRDIIHPNIWVNSLMSGYKPSTSYQMGILDTSVPSYELIGEKMHEGYPNWIITDCRFPNEAKAILDKKGVIIRVNRGDGNTGDHPSETALDDYDMFNHVINNNGTIADLVEEVKKVLIIEELYEV